MRLLQIDYFLAVAETLNFTAAAKSLYISQPALSKQIALLEEELGVRLFVRTSRKVELTEAGQQFMKDLSRIRVQLDQAKNRVMEIGGGRRTITVACFDGAVFNDFLPATSEMLKKRFPDTEIRMFRGTFQENKRALETQEADLLLTLDTGEISGPDYTVMLLHRRSAALLYSGVLPLAQKEDLGPKDFDGERFLILAERLDPPLYRIGLSNLRKLAVTPSFIEEQENFATLMTNLTFGNGFALLTEQVALETPGLRALKLDDEFGMDVVAIWNKAHPRAKDFEEGFAGLQRFS